MWWSVPVSTSDAFMPQSPSIRGAASWTQESSGFNDQTDPKNYERPWTATIRFDLMPDTELMEHLCENEKDLVHNNG